MEEWRLLKTIETNGAMQMAIDEAIALACSEEKSVPTLRFYRFKPPAITIGHMQSISNFNIDEIRKRGFDCVRRITGGTAVLHKNDLVYSLILPEKFLPYKVVDAYNYLSNGIVIGLEKLGLDARKKHSESKERGDSCYLNENPYDIVVNGKKISGNAQTRLNGIVLQHGTIIVEDNLQELHDCLNFDDKKKEELLKDAKKKVTCVKYELGRSVNISEIEKALFSGFESLFSEKGIFFRAGNLNNYEKRIAKRLYTEKYSTKEWHYRK